MSLNHPKNTPRFLLTGRSGVGKSLLAKNLILGELAEGRMVTVIDYGGTYRQMAELVGGVYVRLAADNHGVVESGLCSPLHVYDLEGLSEPYTQGVMRIRRAIIDNQFLLVDELATARKLLPWLEDCLSDMAGLCDRGVGFCLIGQDEADFSGILEQSFPRTEMDLRFLRGR